MEEIIRGNWGEILLYLKNEYNITDISYRTWLLTLEFHSIVDNTAIITIDDKEIGDNIISFITNRYGKALKVSIAEYTGYELDLEFILKSSVENEKRKSMVKVNRYPFLNARYTFDTFVVGKNNQFAHAGALAAAESPGKVYNPLFIYGGVGLGKTHLMHSIAWYIAEQDPNKKILYTTSEDFTNEVITAVRNNKNSGDNSIIEKLKRKYRSVDVLLLDDVQFIIGKESTQEEFFHTFNTLYESDRQIVISSDRPPKDINPLEDRLRSRFEMGLIADISLPDYETRVAILRKMEEMSDITLNDEVVDYMASNIKYNIRELDGAFKKLVHLTKLEKREINLETSEEVLKDFISPNKKVNITIEYINEVVSEHFNLSPEHIVSSKRNKDIAYPRQICMYLCRELTDYSFVEIGKRLGNKDHTTVLHGYNKIKKDMEKEDVLKNTIDILTKKINPQ